MEDPRGQVFTQTHHSEEDEVFPDGEVLEEHVVLRTEPQALSHPEKNWISTERPERYSPFIQADKVLMCDNSLCIVATMRGICAGNFFA